MKLQQLLARGVVQFDGGFGSQLAARNIHFDCPEHLNITNPDDVRAIHRDYVKAGAQVVETNTLGANPIRLAAHGLAGETARFTEAAVRLVREAGAECIACSMGTTSDFLQPVGMLTLDKAVACFTEQVKAAQGAGADFIFTETLTDLAEARAMWMAAKAADIPFGVSFTFLDNGHTLTGSPPAVCALCAQAMGASLIGVNCVGDLSLLLGLLAEIRAATSLPVIVQPNAGLPEEADGILHYNLTPEAMLPAMREAVEKGAAAIGGCCGTTPGHIRAMAAISKDAPPPAPGGDDIKRVCSLRTSLTLAQAREQAEEMTLDELDITDAPAILVDLRGVDPQEAADGVTEAQLLCRQPLLFRADDAQTLDAALRCYPGVAAVDAPFDAGYGALSL